MLIKYIFATLWINSFLFSSNVVLKSNLIFKLIENGCKSTMVIPKPYSVSDLCITNKIQLNDLNYFKNNIKNLDHLKNLAVSNNKFFIDKSDISKDKKKIIAFLMLNANNIEYESISDYNNCQNCFFEILTGPMCSGKSKELINRYKALQEEDSPSQVFKHTFETRNENNLFSRIENSIVPAESISSLSEIKLNKGTECLLIDEFQFFDHNKDEKEYLHLLEEFLLKVQKNKVKVILSGLNLDFTGNLFFGMITLLELLQEFNIPFKMETLNAECRELGCQNRAYFTGRFDNELPASHSQEKIKPEKKRIEEIEKVKTEYRPVCCNHHTMLSNESANFNNDEEIEKILNNDGITIYTARDFRGKMYSI